jgi:hypothetical protein
LLKSLGIHKVVKLVAFLAVSWVLVELWFDKVSENVVPLSIL